MGLAIVIVQKMFMEIQYVMHQKRNFNVEIGVF